MYMRKLLKEKYAEEQFQAKYPSGIHQNLPAHAILSPVLDSTSTAKKVTGKVTYNGYELHEFLPQRTSVYISQHDLPVGEITVGLSYFFITCAAEKKKVL
ncbi:hypothetical protein K7X08_000289 [Anisodus acutangulus]|uniref:Uncharacterized protein n=1 Tax=Anisodus acutangulus TaxID=402998 RepID=A0A9Q1M5L6_9SOLA|nr:hypothetical protein K7X08_000289 [Anisodus acutangulus]